MGILEITGATTVTLAGRDLTPYISKISIGSTITAVYREDGHVEGIRVDYRAMTTSERRDIEAWVQAHQVDPGRVPIDALIGYDAAADEWRFTVYLRGPGDRGVRIDRATDEPMTRVLRRRAIRNATGLRLAGGRDA